MKLFKGQNTELKIKNQVLTEAAQQRAKRVEQLEVQVDKLKAENSRFQEVGRDLAALQDHNRQLTQAATDCALRVQDLERALQAAGTEFGNQLAALQEHNRQLTQAATDRALRIQELEKVLAESTEKGAQRV